MKVIRITTKQNKKVKHIVRRNIKFYSFEKQYLAIVYEDGNHGYFKLTTVLAIEEI